ncbi:MAG TPA: BatD family protein [bacterium]|nr:BatD family protein [bacterium]
MRQDQGLGAGKTIWRGLAGLLILAVLGLRAAGAASPSDQVGLRLTVDKPQVAVGDSLTLSLEFKQVGSGNGIQTGEPSVPTPENFELRGSSSSTQVIASDGNVYEVMTTKYNLVATKEGVETLGPASLIYLDPKKGRQEIQSDTVRVTVTPKSAFSFFSRPRQAPTTGPTPPAADDLQDVKPLTPHYGFFIVLFWLVVVLLVVGFVVRLWKRRPVSPAAPMAQGEETWRDSIKKLFNEELPSKEFCLKLSLLVRQCLEERFGFPAADYTTGEILGALRAAKASSDTQEAAEKCLKVCDRVLYAEGVLGSKDNLKAWALVLAPKTPKKK